METNCKNCGAPIDYRYGHCQYCETLYPDRSNMPPPGYYIQQNLALTKSELQRQMMIAKQHEMTRQILKSIRI